jgi:hypothetical protein
MSDLKCGHCNRVITDLSKAYSRSGEHWCGWSCFDQDQYPNYIAERKERAKKRGKRKCCSA